MSRAKATVLKVRGLTHTGATSVVVLVAVVDISVVRADIVVLGSDLLAVGGIEELEDIKVDCCIKELA